MSRLAVLALDDIQARIELQENQQGYRNDAPGAETVIRMTEQLDPLMKIAKYIIDRTKLVSPDEVALNFGISANGEGGFLCFAKAGVEAQFNVTLTWKKPESGKNTVAEE